ncbi:MAG: hypothetical protein ACJAQ4_002261 [Cryomorphaceae bacterium]
MPTPRYSCTQSLLAVTSVAKGFAKPEIGVYPQYVQGKTSKKIGIYPLRE